MGEMPTSVSVTIVSVVIHLLEVYGKFFLYTYSTFVHPGAMQCTPRFFFSLSPFLWDIFPGDAAASLTLNQ
jgi:hypothetical protein